MRIGRGAASGSGIILLIGIIFITMMMAAFGIDFAFYFAAQNQLQTDADSAALAAATNMYMDSELDPQTRLKNSQQDATDFVALNSPKLTLTQDDVIFGFVSPTTKIYDPSSFRTPSTSSDYSMTKGYNSVYVRVRQSEGSPNQPLNTILANMVGVAHMNTEAHSIALVDQTVNTVTNGGLRPIYVCEAQFRKAMEDGIPENNTIRIYGDHLEIDGVQNVTGCPSMGSGNWGFADLRNCSPDAVGTSTIKDWFSTGFPGTVTTGECYSTDPGNFISSITPVLDTLISSQTRFPLPLYNSWSGGGSNTAVNVSGFVGFQISGYKANGSQASRYIEGHFNRMTCKTGCSSGGANGTETTPGGSVVKIRLASTS